MGELTFGLVRPRRGLYPRLTPDTPECVRNAARRSYEPPPVGASVSPPRPRLLALGLDSVSPWVLHERFLSFMPRLRELLNRSRFGTLRSVDPPITVPAWAVMFSGVDPGSLGLYGFRHRRPGSYFDQYVPSSLSLTHPMVWDQLSRAGKRVCVLGMPPGYPPPHVNGVYVSDFLTPDGAKEFVYPASLQPEVERVAGTYVFDVRFRADDRERVGRELIEMTRKHFEVARFLWTREEWDFFALHEIGPDRIHHAFWKYIDPTHPRYEDNPALRALAEEYYVRLDHEIGSLLDLVPPDVRVVFVSDHGSQGMVGCFCINEWLIRQGYLVLQSGPPPPGTPLEEVPVDWKRTRAWGAGGYYARISFNIRGREPQGVLDGNEVPALRRQLAAELAEVRTPRGSLLGADVRAPHEIYRSVRGDAPDLMVYFGGLTWRSAGTLGHSSNFLTENDTGPDDSVHSFDGIYVVADPTDGVHGPGPARNLIDIGPTFLQRFGLPTTSSTQGVPIPNFW
ncbi:MAG: alkaline phosphatase family protein [Thermoplasmata archaeon]|nr:alkaline phosphatase family protein [Thermoplasmata archaeon]